MIDQNQLESLYDDYAKELYGYFISFTRSEADAADLLQDTFVKLARNPRCLDRVANVRAYLFRMARNLAIDWSRRGRSRRDRVENLARNASPLLREHLEVERGNLRQRVEDALALLPEEQRSAVYLKLWGELTAAEIGQACGVSENTVSSRYRYGLDKLRKILRPAYDDIHHEPSASTDERP